MKKITTIVLVLTIAISSIVLPIDASDSKELEYSNTQLNNMLNETFIECDYETREKTVYKYSDIVESLSNSNPDYTDFTVPCVMPNSTNIIDSVNNSKANIQSSRSETEYHKVGSYIAPFKYTMRIEVKKTDGSNSSFGTGFMISEYVMLTCAHVVWMDNVEEIKIYPFNNNPITSLDTETYYHPRSWGVSTNFSNAAETDYETRAHYDWCYIILHEPLGATTGYYSYAMVSDNVTDYPVRLTGYPGNVANNPIPNFQRFAQYWIGGTYSVLNTQRVIHNCAGLKGHSGSPLYLSGNNIVIGIYTGGETNHYGVRLTVFLYNLLTDKINQYG